MKSARFLGSALNDLRALPKAARQDLGYQIDQVQLGREPDDWPMPTVGRGVREIRVSDDGNIYRGMYVTNIGDKVYVLHVFAKKSHRTPKRDIDIAKTRLKALQMEIKRRR